MPDAAGEVALEAPDGFFGAFAFGPLARDVVLRLGMAAQAGDGDAVDGRVDLAVAAAVESVAVRLARDEQDRRDAGGARELGVGCEPLGAGDFADELGRGQRAESGLEKQVRGDLGDQVGDLGFQFFDRLAQFTDAAQLIASDPDAHRLLRPREARAIRGAQLP